MIENSEPLDAEAVAVTGHDPRIGVSPALRQIDGQGNGGVHRGLCVLSCCTDRTFPIHLLRLRHCTHRSTRQFAFRLFDFPGPSRPVHLLVAASLEPGASRLIVRYGFPDRSIDVPGLSANHTLFIQDRSHSMEHLRAREAAIDAVTSWSTEGTACAQAVGTRCGSSSVATSSPTS